MKRNNSIYAVFLLVFLAGCNSLRKIPGFGKNDPPPDQTLPDIYTIRGTTSLDFQIIQPIRVVDSAISIRVKIPGAAAFRDLNQYEFGTTTVGVGGGGIWFKKKVDVSPYGTLTLYSTPAAPKGTDYEITSTRTGPSPSSHALY